MVSSFKGKVMKIQDIPKEYQQRINEIAEKFPLINRIRYVRGEFHFYRVIHFEYKPKEWTRSPVKHHMGCTVAFINDPKFEPTIKELLKL